MIKKVKEGFKVTSEKGKNLGGPYKTREEAEKRLRQVEFFKHRGKA
jgi:phosphosulfolactate synthase (CoM biosynthesis protein A)